ncbi:MAG: D-alanine--D-alanine ligase [Verrucomicrobiales bacterium]|nr:D-alanine--D-alanine ligase [Verrucomicrobiales bacterium]
MSASRNVCVLLGGPSAEREVSLRSGAAVARALRASGWTVSEVDPVGSWSLPPGTDAVFVALHGTYGEDGTVQEELEALGVPYTGCGPEASRVAFDKVRTKERLRLAGVPTARHVVVADPAAPWPVGWEPPMVVKPVRQGSSVGLRFVERREDWGEALRECLRYDTEALVEERIAGREVTIGILDGAALPVVEVRPKGGAYDYRSKYTAGETEYLCPAPFAPDVTARLQAAGLGAFEAVGGRDYARVDVMVDKGDEPFVLEVNTLPGMTETSLLPKAAAAAGIDFVTLCGRMVASAIRRRREER